MLVLSHRSRLALSKTPTHGGAVSTERGQRRKGNYMNPNTSVYFASIQEYHQQLDRAASRGWAAELAATHGGTHKPSIATSLKRLMSATLERPHQLIREATTSTAPASATTTGMDFFS
jgi:hypothetical protein